VGLGSRSRGARGPGSSRDWGGTGPDPALSPRLRQPPRHHLREPQALPGAGVAVRGVGCQLRQVSLRAVFVEVTVAVRLAPLSQVTFPDASLRMYLYSKDVPSGSSTSSFHTG